MVESGWSLQFEFSFELSSLEKTTNRNKEINADIWSALRNLQLDFRLCSQMLILTIFSILIIAPMFSLKNPKNYFHEIQTPQRKH